MLVTEVGALKEVEKEEAEAAAEVAEVEAREEEAEAGRESRIN